MTRRCYVVIGFDVDDDLARKVEAGVRTARAIADRAHATDVAVFATYAEEHQTRLAEIEREIAGTTTEGTPECTT